MLQTQNPATGEIIETHNFLSQIEIDQKIQLASKALQAWGLLSLSRRSQIISQMGDELLRARDELAKWMCLEMGKPLKAGLQEVEKSAQALQWMAKSAPEILAPQQNRSFGPFGILLSVMPWNYPVWQVVRVLASALPAGNVVLLKPSENSCRTQMLLCEIFDRAFPHLIQHVLAKHEDVSKIIQDRRIRGVTLTGSVRAGRALASLAGENLKKCVLELGGSDAALVLPDADLKMAAQIGAQSRMVNSGQSCISTKRFFVPQKKSQEFCQNLQDEFSKMQIGDPGKSGIDYGPLAHKKFQMELQNQTSELVKNGASRTWGKEVDEQKPGAFFTPQVLQMDSYSFNDQAWSHELFGPVACVWTYDSVEAAIEKINHCSFGLGATIFTAKEKVNEVHSFADKLDVGIVAINRLLASQADLPFGGVKDSGFGKELGREGIIEWTQVKTHLEPIS